MFLYTLNCLEADSSALERSRNVKKGSWEEQYRHQQHVFFTEEGGVYGNGRCAGMKLECISSILLLDLIQRAEMMENGGCVRGLWYWLNKKMYEDLRRTIFDGKSRMWRTSLKQLCRLLLKYVISLYAPCAVKDVLLVEYFPMHEIVCRGNKEVIRIVWASMK